ncbi:COX15/CtaA family protein [Ornithinimicrobium cerasi]|uniref:COX15/CtaA family protein n=1 Tax=Ornithinimicrobium cerasi TaxID=2248773 RepID=UPI000F0034EB|nr:COX15/CtaA family protein [Ornithinimicrobium cerasi]
MTTQAPPRPTSRLLPTEPDGWVRATAWFSLTANALLVLTGGLVRLTGSGLGCPTWPRCTDDSWTSTAEMGMHGAIEFGNRLLTFLVALAALLAFLAVVRQRRRHPDLFVLALGIGLGVVVQAVVGGVTVRTGLNPWVVGVHFVLSALMIAAAAVLVCRARRLSLPAVARTERGGQVTGPAARTLRGLAVVLGVLTFVVIYVGTLVTGTGPHAGDSGEVARHAFDPYWITRFHTAPAYLLLAGTVGAVVLGVRDSWPAPLRRLVLALLVVLVLQALVGYYQFFSGLPVAAVALHLVGAAVLAALAAAVVDTALAVSRAEVTVPEPVAGPAVR